MCSQSGSDADGGRDAAAVAARAAAAFPGAVATAGRTAGVLMAALKGGNGVSRRQRVRRRVLGRQRLKGVTGRSVTSEHTFTEKKGGGWREERHHVTRGL